MKSRLHYFDRFALRFAFAAVAIIVLVVPEANTQTATPQSRNVPARTVPVPNTVSPEMQALIAAPLSANWNVAPKSLDEWRPLSAASAGRGLPALRERFGVKTEALTVNGVNAFMVTPSVIPPENRNRLLIHVHGGCYVLSGGEAATTEHLHAGSGTSRLSIASSPSRLPHPAALDSGWRRGRGRGSFRPEELATSPSAVGALTLSMVLARSWRGCRCRVPSGPARRCPI